MQTRHFLPGVLACALAGTLSAQVVINEVAYDGVGSDDGQVFVELWGPPGMDISGWVIQGIEGRPGSAGTCNSQSFSFPAGATIPADGLVVVADSDAAGVTLVANADYTDPNMDLENGEDAVQLIDNNGRVVDAVAYGPVDTSVGPMSACNGGVWFEGNPARDVFAPLSIERCPAGADTNDNDTDFTPNFPSPGVAESCCTAIEYVNRGVFNTLTTSNGDSVGLDAWFSCGANQPYLFLASFTDPTVVAPPAPFPVFDASTSTIAGFANVPPFVAWGGVLDGNGRVLGTAALDFSTIPIVLGMPATTYIGAVAFSNGGGIVGTNSVEINLQ